MKLTSGLLVFLLVVAFGCARIASAQVVGDCSGVNVRCVDDTSGPTQEYLTIQAAANAAQPGDTVRVFDGTYGGFVTVRNGTPSSPILFQASGTGAIVNSAGNSRGDNINVEGTSYIIVDGFRVQNAGRGGIRVVRSRGVIVRNNIVRNPRVWGIFSGFAPEIQILTNQTSGAIEQHGIYVSNSDVAPDNPVIRGNVVYGNFGNGIQINGDCLAGGDGVITGAILENNIVHDNGFKGFSLISMQNSVVQNNVIYNNGTRNAGAGGIHLADEPGCGKNSDDNVVVNNTIQEPRIAPVRITHGTRNVLFNNIAISGRPVPIVDEFGGNIIDGSSNLTSNSGTGFFVSAAAGDFHLAPGSPAIDRGRSSLAGKNAPAVDLEGRTRPQGVLYDAGAYEFASNVGTGPLIYPGGVVNNAGYTLASSALAPGAIAAIFGSRLTDGTSCLPPSCYPAFGSNSRLNTTMSGAQVTVNGTPVPIYYALPGQLGIQIPTELTGNETTIHVSVGGQSGSPQTVSIEPVSPGIFTFTGDGRGAGAITYVDGSPVSAQNPARPGQLVILYATGLGQVSPAAATGARPTGESRAVVAATVVFDGVSVIPEFAGLAGCCVGLNQVNVRVPEGTRSANDIPVVLTIGGKQSNAVTVAVQ